MAYKLQIVDAEKGFNMNVRFENMARLRRPEVVAKNTTGATVKNCTVYQGTVLGKGSTQKKWMDEHGVEFSKSELSFFIKDEEVEELSMTRVLDIEGYQELSNYTDMYVIDRFYELYASDNDMKKDIDRQRAIATNKTQMFKLWEYLKKEGKVARGEFCPASRGFIASDGYIRAIEVDGKWGMEIGVFKEAKEFTHLQEGKPKSVAMPESSKKKRVKMI